MLRSSWDNSAGGWDIELNSDERQPTDAGDKKNALGEGGQQAQGNGMQDQVSVDFQFVFPCHKQTRALHKTDPLDGDGGSTPGAKSLVVFRRHAGVPCRCQKATLKSFSTLGRSKPQFHRPRS
jgi:hypothetical protein